MRAAAVALACWVGAATMLHSQAMRDFSVERARNEETRLRAVISFGAGELALRPSRDGSLYRMRVRYDADRYAPYGTYDPQDRLLRLGLDRQGSAGLRVANREQLAQRATVELSPEVGLTLEAELGAAESTLDLGGLKLEDLVLSTGASRTEVRFSQPNAALCRSATISAGAAELVLRQLGNSGCRRFDLQGGVGAVTLNLEGAWQEDARGSIQMALGGVTLEIPSNLGVRLRMSRFLASLQAQGFTKDGRTYTSNNYSTASRHVDLEISSTLGEVQVVWTR